MQTSGHRWYRLESCWFDDCSGHSHGLDHRCRFGGSRLGGLLSLLSFLVLFNSLKNLLCIITKDCL
jgi:hypothetical protein